MSGAMETFGPQAAGSGPLRCAPGVLREDPRRASASLQGAPIADLPPLQLRPELLPQPRRV